MNVKLKKVLLGITGTTEMLIIDAIFAGERNVHKLADLRDARCEYNEAETALDLEGGPLATGTSVFPEAGGRAVSNVAVSDHKV